MISPTERLVATVEGPLGWVTFNNPERRNAITMDMYEAIPVVLRGLEADPNVRVIILAGAGDKAFVSGSDISQFDTWCSSPEGVARHAELVSLLRTTIQTVEKPTVAMIRGYCIGGGLSIALDCDLRIASGDARFGVPSARLGTIYRWDNLKRMVELVGPARASEILFVARTFGADEAHRIGIVNHVVPPAELESFVRAYCATIAENAPLAIAAMKTMIRELSQADRPPELTNCEAAIARCSNSQDYVEGPRAFKEKRRPNFTGS